MRIDLRYGEGFLSIEEDRHTRFTSAFPTQVPSVSNLESETLRALNAPRYADPLSSQIRPRSKIVIVVEGPLQPQHGKQMMDSVLSTLLSSGVNAEDVTIISALEGDRKNALLEMLEKSKTEEYQLTIHDSLDESRLELIGNTPTHSTPIFVSDEFVKSDFRIGIGAIRPTPFGGATGGRMAVLPGIAGERTRFHNMKLMATKSIGSLSIDSPCAKDMAEAAELADLNFIINSVVDYKDDIAEIMAGDLMMAWADGVMLSRRLTIAKVSRRADIVVVSAGGAGNDSTLYGSISAIESALEASRLGGIIILLAECSAGVGSDGFVRGVSDYASENELVVGAETDYEPGMERARLLLRGLASTRRIIICSRLRPSLVEERLRCMAVKDAQEGLEVARRWIGSMAHISVIPNGVSILPRLHSS